MWLVISFNSNISDFNRKETVNILLYEENIFAVHSKHKYLVKKKGFKLALMPGYSFYWTITKGVFAVARQIFIDAIYIALFSQSYSINLAYLGFS